MTCHRHVLLLCVALCLPTGSSHADTLQELVIIATQRIPKVDRLIDELKSNLGTGVVITVHDMQGKKQIGDRLMSELASSLPTTTRVVTLGTPATKLAARHLVRHSIFSTYVGAPTDVTDLARVVFIESDPTLADMLGALQAVWPATATVALVHERSATAQIEAAVAGLESGIDLKLIPVNRSSDVVSAMSATLDQVDAFVFPREANVLSRRSLQRVADFLNENKIPAVSYSRYLVSAGFPAAVVTNATRVGKDLASALRGQHPRQNSGAFDLLFINKSFASRMDMQAKTLPSRAKLL